MLLLLVSHASLWFCKKVLRTLPRYNKTSCHQPLYGYPQWVTLGNNMPTASDKIPRLRGPFYLHLNYNETMAKDILSASGRKTENGSGESCPNRNLSMTPPACGSEYQNEQITHMYPNHGCQELPKCSPVIRLYAHCTKSSTLIANA